MACLGRAGQKDAAARGAALALTIVRKLPLTLVWRSSRQMPVRVASDEKLPTNIFFKKILKVLQRGPLKNTSELKWRASNNRTLIAAPN
jgi:hypothetical protein